MSKYVCLECGYMGSYDDFLRGECPACGSNDVSIVDERECVYDLDRCLDLGESMFYMDGD